MNVNDWKLSLEGVVLAQILKYIPGIEQNKVVTKALDGSFYIQTIGTGNPYADVTILASRLQMEAINQAEADGVYLTAVYREHTVMGYIETAPSWTDEEPGEWYTTTIKLLIAEEVST